MNSDESDMSGAFQFINQSVVTNAMASGQNIDWAQLAAQWIQMQHRENTTSLANERKEIPVSHVKYDEEKGEADMDMDDEQTDICHNDGNTRDSVMQHLPANDENAHWSIDKRPNADIGNDIFYICTCR